MGTLRPGNSLSSFQKKFVVFSIIPIGRDWSAQAPSAKACADIATGEVRTHLRNTGRRPRLPLEKALTKEDIVPLSADAVVHFLAPVFLVVVVFMGYAVLPMGRNMTLVPMDAGMLFFFAIGASTELSVFMAGWSSRNKYSLLGAMRAVAQMISYEVPLLMSSVAVVMMTGSLSLDEDRGGAEPVHVGAAALVHFYAVGICGVRHVCDCGHRGDEPLAV